MEKVSHIDEKNTDWNKYYISHIGDNTYLVEYGKVPIVKRDYTYETNGKEVVKRKYCFQPTSVTSYRQSYYEANKADYHKRYKVWYQRNKEIIRERRRLQNQEKMTCVCGKVFQLTNYPRHIKTQSHKKFFN